MDLEDFLNLEDRYGDFWQNLTPYRALEDLSSALECVHIFNLNITDRSLELSRIGYHHDLRPRNILVSSNTFMLTDFGLSRLKVVDETPGPKWRENLGDYIAPECMDDDFRPQEAGRSIDIWAFGGIIIDIAWPEDKNKWDNQYSFRIVN